MRTEEDELAGCGSRKITLNYLKVSGVSQPAVPTWCPRQLQLVEMLDDEVVRVVEPTGSPDWGGGRRRDGGARWLLLLLLLLTEGQTRWVSLSFVFPACHPGQHWAD